MLAVRLYVNHKVVLEETFDGADAGDYGEAAGLVAGTGFLVGARTARLEVFDLGERTEIGPDDEPAHVESYPR